MTQSKIIACVVPVMVIAGSLVAASEPEVQPALWSLAQAKAPIHRFSTVFAAHDVCDRLAKEDDLQSAIDSAATCPCQ